MGTGFHDLEKSDIDPVKLADYISNKGKQHYEIGDRVRIPGTDEVGTVKSASGYGTPNEIYQVVFPDGVEKTLRPEELSSDHIHEYIRKSGGKLGCYDTKAAAKKRLKQMAGFRGKDEGFRSIVDFVDAEIRSDLPMEGITAPPETYGYGIHQDPTLTPIKKDIKRPLKKVWVRGPGSQLAAYDEGLDYGGMSGQSYDSSGGGMQGGSPERNINANPRMNDPTDDQSKHRKSKRDKEKLYDDSIDELLAKADMFIDSEVVVEEESGRNVWIRLCPMCKSEIRKYDPIPPFVCHKCGWISKPAS